MDLELNGRRAFVGGASSGIGEAIAARLAEEGVAVVVHGRDPRGDGGRLPRRFGPDVDWGRRPSAT